MNDPDAGRKCAPEVSSQDEAQPRPSRAGWDPRVDGPMPEDGQKAHELWLAWKAAWDGPEHLEVAAWGRYCRWMRGGDPVPVSEPLSALLQRLLARAVADDAAPGTIQRLEALIEADEAPKPVEPPPGWEYGKSASGWYVSLAGGVERDMCGLCVPQPPDGVKAQLARLYPVEPWMYAPDEEVACSKCGRVR